MPEIFITEADIIAAIKTLTETARPNLARVAALDLDGIEKAHRYALLGLLDGVREALDEEIAARIR